MRKRALVIGIVAAVVVMVAAVYIHVHRQALIPISTPSLTPTPYPAPTAIQVRVGTLPDDDALPLFVARDEGIFERYGLSVELMPFHSAFERDAALTAGEIEASISDPIAVILMQAAGIDVKIVGVEMGKDPELGGFCIVAAPGSDIKTVEDLEGKTIAISRNTIIDFVTDKMLGDVDAKRIDVKKMPERVQMLISGDVDAATLPDILARYAMCQNATLVASENTFGGNLSFTVTVFRGDFVNENPEAVRKFIKAYGEAVNMINTNPEAYKELAVEVAKIPEEVVTEYSVPFFPPPQPYPETFRNNFEEVVAWALNKGLIKDEIAFEDCVWVA
ncbi:MAG TPA: transporter substrate-binding domain-containing protein [Methanomicrobia archaeon]|nr:transporter substrate-binding domain-containing protein [Methanomicrobia archaeon]HEX59391.1 transporter substrate-binding domain-containing protein [Methanomicrobia archaeon]